MSVGYLLESTVVAASNIINPGPPRLARTPRPGPGLDFGFQYALTRKSRSKKLG